jgi:hypothetical protein
MFIICYISAPYTHTHTHTRHPCTLTSILQMLRWARKTTCPLFVAADNPTSLKLVLGEFPNRLVVSGAHFFNMSGVRNETRRYTSMIDAVADMWVATYATDFMGTQMSTFSEYIEYMRFARGGLNPGWFCGNIPPCWGSPNPGLARHHSRGPVEKVPQKVGSKKGAADSKPTARMRKL